MIYLKDKKYTNVIVCDELHQLLNSVKWIHNCITSYGNDLAIEWLRATFKKVKAKVCKVKALCGGYEILDFNASKRAREIASACI